MYWICNHTRTLPFNTSRPYTEIYRLTDKRNERLGKVENEIREIISMRSLHTKAHTFASRTSPSTNQSLQKSVLFASPKRNSFFSSHPSVFYFFATHNRHQNRWTETAKTFTGQGLTMTKDRRPACNIGFAIWRLTCFYETFVLNQAVVHLLNISAKNPPLRQYPKR